LPNSRTSLSGVGARLLIVIFGIGAVSALVAGAAIYAFVEVGHSLALIDRRVDPILASLEVTRSVERIVTAASALSAATTEQRREHLFARLSRQSAKLRSFLDELRDGGISQGQLAPIEGNAALLDANLTALDADVRLRLPLIGRIKDATRAVFDTNEETQRLLAPTVLVYDSQLDRLAKLAAGAGQPIDPNGDEVRSLVVGLLAARPVQKVQQQASDVADSLAQAAVSEQKQRLLILAFQLRRTIGEIEKASQGLDPKLRPLFLAQVDKLKPLVDGPNSIPQLHQHELDLVADAGRLLAENDTLSTELTAAAEQLVEATKREVRGATASALRIQRLSTEAISALLVLGFAGSVLIVWLYVGRNIVRRLNLMSGAMFAIAGGGREIAVPVTGSDEIAAMGRAVEVFRQNAVERDALLAERAAAAERLEHQVEERTAELGQQQAVLRVTFDNMGDGVARFDEGLRLAAWNRNFVEILDLPDTFLIEPHTYADFVRYLAERGEFGAAADPETELRRYTENAGRHYSFERTRPDGRVLEVRHNPVPGGGFVLIYSDITERKRSEAEIHAARDAAEAAYHDLKSTQARLIQAEKMASLGQLTAGIAHEIKNPLNFVNNFASLSVELLDELKETAAPALAALDEDKRADIDEVVGMLTGNLEKIGEHGRRADGIVKSMLEHSRGGTGERREVDLNGLVEEALNLAYHGARAQDQNFNITLERDFDASIPPFELVPQDVTRVLLNLFGNAFYAATKRWRENSNSFRPALTVTTRDFGAAVEIRVRDNGTGIAPEIKDKLFQPFFTTKPTGEGTGLGLSISYDIVTQQHGGTIEVDSVADEFTEFTIRLPRRARVTGKAA
jgi:adenylate cyclase